MLSKYNEHGLSREFRAGHMGWRVKRIFGLRLMLPIFQLILAIGLFAIGWQKMVQFEAMGLWDGPYSVPVAWAYGINLPVVILTLPLNLLIRLCMSRMDIRVMVVVVACFIPPFWYWVGKRLDQALGLLPPRIGARRVPAPFLLAGCGIIALGAGSIYWANRNTYLIQLKLAMLVWIIIGIWAFIRNVRRFANKDRAHEETRRKL
jgi:hypothetical protein